MNATVDAVLSLAEIDLLAAAVAAHGLAGSQLDLPDAPLAAGPWQQLLDRCLHERITGFMALSVADGRLPATDEQIDEVIEVHAATNALALRLERTMQVTADLLDGAGLEFRALKGSAVAHLDYTNPTLRGFGDVDLLVGGAHWDEAAQVCADAFGPRRYPEPRPGFDRRFGKGTSFLTPWGHEIDLHRTLVAGPFGVRIDDDQLMASLETYQLGRRAMPALGRDERLLHSAYHAALGNVPPRLSALRDLAQQVLVGQPDSEAVVGRAVGWRGDAVLARGIKLCWDTFALADKVPLSVWAHRHRADRDAERALESYVGQHRSYAAQSIAAVRAIDGVGSKAAYLRAMLLPERSYLTGRHDGALRRFRSVLAGPATPETPAEPPASP